MANQTIGVNLKFSADVSAAKRAMSELQSSLAQIGNMQPGTHIGTQLSATLGQAQHAAAQLRIQLQSAFNVDTGKLNLTKFNQQMQASGMTLEKYKASLLAIGPEGQQAFNKLAFSIATAETPVLNLSKGIQRLGATFMNTLRYQLSSSVIMGFVQSISEAVDYTKELNESLNNIRVVTNYGADEMKAFAKEANKAAKALSTTTTAMTDASLIYFQQGLNMKEAQERAEITIKLANVTGEAVETVSDQLTAVWNNFYDGSKSLEYYVDVLAALGAATASSSDEISEGLEKFAAVAETVGLSYEYAAAALATVTATTRQSADVVGTAFKTLFARIQDLELGKTLDDDVTLGKYSQALEAVGINILDSTGNLKDMNVILDEMGAKWDSLTKAQQVSLAQTVAGTRQYTQLIALMDEWDYFQQNVGVAEMSSGTLQEQQDIYAESWEAAANRVTVALETIYNKLLDDDFFIDILNTFAKLLDMIDNMIDGLGGLPGVLSLVATALLRAFGPQIASGAQSVANSVMSMTASGRAKVQKQKNWAANELYNATTSGGLAGASAESSRLRAEAVATRASLGDRMSTFDRQVFDTELSNMNDRTDRYLRSSEYQNAVEAQQEARIQRSAVNTASELAIEQSKGRQKQLGQVSQVLSGAVPQTKEDIEKLENELKELNITSETSSEKLKEMFGEAAEPIKSFIQSLQTAKGLMEKFGEDKVSIKDTYKETQGAVTNSASAEQKLQEDIQARKTALNQGANQFGQGVTTQRMLTAVDLAEETPLTSLASGQTGSTTQQLQAVEELQSRLRNLGVTADGLSEQLSTVIDKGTYEKPFKEYAAAADRVQQALQELQQTEQSGGDTAKAKQKVNNELQALNQKENQLKKLAAAEIEEGRTTMQSNGATDAYTVSVERNAQGLGQHQVEIMEDRQQIEHLIETMKKAGTSTMDFGQKMQTFANITMTVSTAINNTVIGIIDVWQKSEEEMPLGEKLLSTFSSLAMVLPMVTTLLNEQTLAFLGNVAAAIAAKLPIQTLGTQALITAAQEGTLITANGALAVSTWSVILPIGILLASLAAIIGIIILVANAFEKEKTAAEKAAETAKAHAAALEAVSTAADEAANKLQTVKDILTQYYDVANAFDGLVEGSQAYNENLEKEQELINQLLETYPELMDMGVISLKNGRYQVTDEALLNQYVQGMATVSENNAKYSKQMATYWANMTNVDAQYKKDKEQAEKYLGWDNYHSGLSTRTKLNNDGTLRYVLAGESSGEEILNFTSHEAMMAADAKALEWTKSITEGQATFEDIANTLTEGDEELYRAWKERLETESKAVFEIEKANERYISGIEQANTQLLNGYKVVINQILQTQKGFSNLTAYQQEAVTTLAAAEAVKKAKENKYSIERDQDFSKELGNYILKATGIEGEWDPNAQSGVNDIGDFFVNTVAGKEAASVYLREVKDMQSMTLAEMNIGDYSYDTKGMKNSDGEYIVEWSEIAGYYNAEWAMEDINFDKLMQEATKRSEAANAAITGDITRLSEEQLSRIATGSREEGYKLITDSEDIVEAAEALQMSAEKYETWIANLQEQVKNYDAALAETLLLQQEIDEGNAIISEAAEKYGLEADVVENYAKSLYNANDAQELSYKSAVQLAISNARLSKGLKALRDNWEDISDALNSYEKDSYEWIEAATEASNALTDIFGVTVSTDFIAKYQSEIQTLVDGGEEAEKVFQELELLAGQDYIISLGLDKDYQIQFNSMLKELTNQEYDGITIGIEGDISKYKSALEKLLNENAITVDEVNAMFNSIGWSPEIKTDTIPGPPSVSVTKISTYGNEADAELGDDNNATSTSWQRIQTSTSVPVYSIGDVAISTPKSSSSIKSTVSSGGSSNRKQSRSKEKDRYHGLKESLSDLEREYSRIADAKDRAWGPDKLAYMEQERAILEQELKTQEQLVKAMRADVDKDFNALSKYGASRDSSGRLTNYDEMWNANLNLNDDAWEEFTEALSQYEETLNGFEEEEQKLLDMNNQMIDSYMEEIQYTVENTVETIENVFTVLEHQIENLSDPIYEAANAIAVLGQQAELSLNKVETYRTGIQKTLEQSGFSKSEIDSLLSGDASFLEGRQLSQSQIEALTEYQEALWDSNKEIEGLGETVHEKLVGAVEEMNSKFEEQSDIIAYNGNILDSYRNIIDLVGEDVLGISDEIMNELSRSSVENAKASMSVAKSQYDMNKKLYDDTMAEYNLIKDSLTGQEKERWEETIKNLQEQLNSSEEAFMSSWTDSLEAAADAFDTAVERAVTTFQNAMAGLADTADVLEQRFERSKELSELYLQDYEKIYNLSKLNRDITRSMEETENIKGLSRLRDLQEEINDLQESGAQITQYEVDEIRARYELRLAEIALEEAQNAKSQVRMRRDSEGNWGYVYTADEEVTASAQQNYEDKLYAYQDFIQGAISESEAALVEIPRLMAEAIAAIDKNAYESESEYLAAVEEVRTHYATLYEYHLNQINKGIKDSSVIYEEDWQAYNEKTGYKISLDKDWRDQFEETNYSQITGYKNIDDALSAFTSSSKLLLESLTEAYSNWRADVDKIFDLADTDLADFKNDVAEKTKAITTENETAAQSAKDMGTDFKGAYSEILINATEWANQYVNKFKGVIEENNNIAASIGNILIQYQDIIDKVPAVTAAFEEINRSATSDGNDDGEQDINDTSTTVAIRSDTDHKTINGVQYVASDGEQRSTSGLWYALKELKLINTTSTAAIYDTTNAKLYSFDTGGYTGSWDSSGRLAMLHQKEIVLNAHDTENFLAAVNIVRDIASMIDLRAAAQTAALSAMSAMSIAPMTQTIDQNVIIHAEFPNATNHTEIEEAFHSLVNQAAQFANRKN